MTWVLALCAWVAILPQALADEAPQSATIDIEGSRITDEGRGVRLTLSLSEPVPYRVFTLDDPMRVIMDFSGLSLSGFDASAVLAADGIEDALSGMLRPGWSRLVLLLRKPLHVKEAGMTTGPDRKGARVDILLSSTDATRFSDAAGEPPSSLWSLPPVADVAAPVPRQRGDRPVTVVLDPGHGGLDPGALSGDFTEADLMLRFAFDLRDALERAGSFNVVLTREDDRFVSLARRLSIARAARADLFLSLHADALEEGRASGAAIYTLSEKASDAASARLAARHDRMDLLTGLDLSEQDDTITSVLMDLARAETAPRSERLAGALVNGLRATTGDLHKRPRLRADFSVLRAPDIPSALIEIGFMSSPEDLSNLVSPEWREMAAAGIVAGLKAWVRDDAAEAARVRR